VSSPGPDRAGEIGQRVTHLLEQLEAIRIDPTLKHDPAEGRAAVLLSRIEAELDHLEAELREIRRTIHEVLGDDDD
jgi:hypothetical protein